MTVGFVSRHPLNAVNVSIHDSDIPGNRAVASDFHMLLANDLGSSINEGMVADFDNRFTGIQVKAGVSKQ